MCVYQCACIIVSLDVRRLTNFQSCFPSGRDPYRCFGAIRPRQIRVNATETGPASGRKSKAISLRARVHRAPPDTALHTSARHTATPQRAHGPAPRTHVDNYEKTRPGTWCSPLRTLLYAVPVYRTLHAPHPTVHTRCFGLGFTRPPLSSPFCALVRGVTETHAESGDASVAHIPRFG